MLTFVRSTLRPEAVTRRRFYERPRRHQGVEDGTIAAPRACRRNRDRAGANCRGGTRRGRTGQAPSYTRCTDAGESQAVQAPASALDAYADAAPALGRAADASAAAVCEARLPDGR